MKIVAVTRCATGIAHTYMAADRLMMVVRARKFQIKIETQGAMGVENRLSARDIAEADVAILVADVSLTEEARFADALVVRASTLDAIENPEGLLESAIKAASRLPKATGNNGT